MTGTRRRGAALAALLTAVGWGALLEVVETAPLGSELDRRQVANAIDRFPELFAAAESTLDIAEMYMLYYPPESKGRLLYRLYDGIMAAAQRGVRVRVLLDSATLEGSPTETYRRMRERLAAVPGIEVRAADLRRLSPYPDCMMHAKYFVVDSRLAVVGSHNWSFGGFADNRELSLVIHDGVLAGQVRGVFETDWAAASGQALPRTAADQCPAGGRGSVLRLAVAGPVESGEYRLTDAVAEIMSAAESTLDVEVNSISPRIDFGPGTRFGLVESLLQAAAGRGVRVRLLVDRWAWEQEPEFLRGLMAIPGVEVRVADITRAGPNTGAGTMHAKFVVADRRRLLLGTATFSQRQLTACRNLAVVVDDPATATAVADVFERDWFSIYARPR